MAFVPALLRQRAGYNHTPARPFNDGRAAAGITGLSARDQRRLEKGARHAVACGRRCVGDIFLQIARDGLDVEEMLSLLDSHQSVDPEVARALGGDIFPKCPFDVVPR